jgi:CRISPR-associated protein Csm3
MSNNEGTIRTLIDKLVITADIKLLTGMHIGSSNEFASIGAVDSVVVRDPVTKKPIIPGSSLKGKMRTLLAKALCNDIIVNHVDKDSEALKRLFGASKPKIKASRLQFYDLFLLNDEEIKRRNTDLYLTEIKFENTIDRATAVATPRQIERVPAGALFKLQLVYNVEDNATIEEDFEMLTLGFKLLQLDYLGGSGSRGYGKVAFDNFKVEAKNLTTKDKTYNLENFENQLKGVREYALLSV